ncbi:MAG: transcription-repair coupling factor, partial [Kiloniellales bacterium]|nr:transcription-repair coupling factor [Kiloniellales bacterium]
TGPVEQATIGPVSELLIDQDSIERFRTGYRREFGASLNDPLYEAVSAGRQHQGMEHWLPLFYAELFTLFAYLPEETTLSFDYQVDEALGARFDTIEDFYHARQGYEGVAKSDGWIYRPLNPAALYLGRGELESELRTFDIKKFFPFNAPSQEKRTDEEGSFDPGIQDGGGRAGIDFADVRADPEANLFDAVKERLLSRASNGERILVAAYSAGARERLASLLSEHGMSSLLKVENWREFASLRPGQIALGCLPVEVGFACDDGLIVTERDILGERLARATKQRRRAENFLTEVSTLGEGDLVVHIDNGVGRYEGLIALDVSGAPHDCLKIVYQGGDKLYVPVENMDVLSRYGDGDGVGELDRLGSTNWQARKARIKQRLKDMAAELIKIAAAREMQEAEVIQPPEGLYEEFSARFSYPETEDQLRAIEETLEDLASGRSMDRLVCGDVGFGKTEIALRAAFVAAMAGHQVAVVVPTTLLARQHFQTFRERFRGLPIEIRQLSRLVNAKAQAQTRAELSEGKIDILIGTHAVLGKQVRFRDLGLLIIDEEQHFGVRQKERLKALREEVHVLTLTATPIPRTLQLAMSGVKEMSLIATPPVDRLAVRTFVLPFDPVIVREAIMREHFRGGQVFYVCPRLQDLDDVKERLSKLVPEVKVGIAHGQLTPSVLETVMTAFYDGRFDVLLSTNIVESGLDVPTANTLIVHRADMFGLSQLYQIRGRIGRSKLRAYAYFTLPSGRILTSAAEKRLHVMQTLDGLGAGFQLASYDLDIRGAGNILGEEQSGHIKEVGIELYQQMLEEAVVTARSSKRRGTGDSHGEGGESFTPQITLGTSVLIPETYVHDLNVRLGLYRRLSTLVDRKEIEAFAAELIDRFGPIPEEVENLLEIMTIKQLCRD